jgi:SAM-dependent methyltransferase
VVEATSGVGRMLDVEAGVGNLVAALPRVPSLTVATEAWPPAVARAAPRLAARGAHLVPAAHLPFRDATFDLVVSRHPVTTDWAEVARVLAPGGRYLSQQVGPHSLRDLSEHVLGPLPTGSTREPEAAAAAAEAAGLEVAELRHERLPTTFSDIGAVVYFLRLVVWIVPGFDVERHHEPLLALHERIERDGAYETTASRFLIDARKPG